MPVRTRSENSEYAHVGEQGKDDLSIAVAADQQTVTLIDRDGQKVQIPEWIIRISALRQDYSRKLTRMDGQEFIRRNSGRVYAILMPHRGAAERRALKNASLQKG